jgi:hypothetical protein
VDGNPGHALDSVASHLYYSSVLKGWVNGHPCEVSTQMIDSIGIGCAMMIWFVMAFVCFVGGMKFNEWLTEAVADMNDQDDHDVTGL